MEPDHCQTLLETLERYPNCKMVGTLQHSACSNNSTRLQKPDQYLHKEGDEICQGKHTLVSYTMPMVHWPEVNLYIWKSTGTLFSADAFGTFGTVNGNIFADQTDFVATYEEKLVVTTQISLVNTVLKYKMQFVKFLVLKSNALLHFMVQSGVHLKRLNTSRTNTLHWSSYTAEKKKALLSLRFYVW